VAKLAALDEFKSQKEELLAKLVSYEQQIQMLENEHISKLYEVDKKNVLDKDRHEPHLSSRIFLIISFSKRFFLQFQIGSRKT
jgi:hypothetical protein